MKGPRTMRAAWYESQGPASKVLQVGDLPVGEPGAGEVRIRVRVSAVNPGDTKKRNGDLGPMAFPRIVPHSDGAGEIEAVGEGVDPSRAGERVWIFNAQSGRPEGTAAEYTIIPAAFAVPLPEGVAFEAGAALGIPARTAWHALLADGPIQGKTILVSGANGSVGRAAVELGHLAGARIVAAVRNDDDAEDMRLLGAALVVNSSREDLRAKIREFTEERGVDRIVEVAFGANAEDDFAMIATGGTIAAYSSDADANPRVPFWAGVAKAATLRFVAVDLIDLEQTLPLPIIVRAVEAGGLRAKIADKLPLERVAEAHEIVEKGGADGKVLLDL